MVIPGKPFGDELPQLEFFVHERSLPQGRGDAEIQNGSNNFAVFALNQLVKQSIEIINAARQYLCGLNHSEYRFIKTFSGVNGASNSGEHSVNALMAFLIAK